MFIAKYTKDPNAKLPYTVDFSEYLEGSETIATATVTSDVSLDITGTAIVNTGTGVTFWADNGIVPIAYKVVVEIETTTGKKDRRSIIIECQNM